MERSPVAWREQWPGNKKYLVRSPPDLPPPPSLPVLSSTSVLFTLVTSSLPELGLPTLPCTAMYLTVIILLPHTDGLIVLAMLNISTNILTRSRLEATI